MSHFTANVQLEIIRKYRGYQLTHTQHLNGDDIREIYHDYIGVASLVYDYHRGLDRKLRHERNKSVVVAIRRPIVLSMTIQYNTIQYNKISSAQSIWSKTD